MDLQQVLRVAGWAMLAASGSLLAATARYAIRHDVRGVADDLSGRKRLQRIDESVGRPASERHDAAWATSDEPSSQVPRQGRPADAAAGPEEPVTEVVGGRAREEGLTPGEDQLTLVDDICPGPGEDCGFDVRREVVLCGSEHEVGEGGVLQ